MIPLKIWVLTENKNNNTKGLIQITELGGENIGLYYAFNDMDEDEVIESFRDLIENKTIWNTQF